MFTAVDSFIEERRPELVTPLFHSVAIEREREPFDSILEVDKRVRFGVFVEKLLSRFDVQPYHAWVLLELLDAVLLVCQRTAYATKATFNVEVALLVVV